MELFSKVKEIAGPIVERVWNFEERRQNLKRKLQELQSIEADVTYELETRESLFGKKRRKEVDNWLLNAERIKNEVSSFEQMVEDNRLKGTLGENLEKMTEKVTDLIERSRFEAGLVHEVNESEEALLTAEFVGQAFHTNKDRIWKWLMKDGIECIGVYGMGGVGKTMLVTHIHNELLQSRNSSYRVYWVTVSQDFSICKLQNLIARTISLDLSDEEDEKKRAAKLSKALMGKHKCVLILDDLWNHFAVEKVGIPIKEKDCKLLLTTRSLEVCRRMGCQGTIKVEPLTEDEAWGLFQEKIGQPLCAQVEHTAKALARECAGLPLGIIAMAASMRGSDDVCEWRNALRELQESKAGPGDMEPEVFQILKFSYNRLTDSTLQQCFLYCAPYPEDHRIYRKDLIEYLIVEGLIQGGSRAAEYDKGHTILNRLEKVCLLDGVMEFGTRYVKMHDLIRDMAIQITEADSRVIVKPGMQLANVPNWGNWKEDLVKVSLMNNRILEIPRGYSPRCPGLTTLLLRGNEQLKSVADSFFKQLMGLKVLDLSGTAVTELPNSMSDLVNLNALILKFCPNLRRVPSLAKLGELTKLNLNVSGIEEVPEGMELLSKLRYLNLYQTRLKELPSGILPRLCSLQILYLDPSLPVKGEEVATLSKLETWNCRFNDVKIFAPQRSKRLELQ